MSGQIDPRIEYPQMVVSNKASHNMGDHRYCDMSVCPDAGTDLRAAPIYCEMLTEFASRKRALIARKRIRREAAKKGHVTRQTMRMMVEEARDSGKAIDLIVGSESQKESKDHAEP